MIPKSGSRFSDQIMLKRKILRERTASMAKKQTDSVYRIVDVVGVSDKSWEDAGRRAVETAAGSLRDLRVAEVTKMDMRVENGKVLAFRTRVALSFKYEA
jgi:dodecin